MNELSQAQFIGPCFSHGHFGFVKPAATNDPIRKVIHYQSQMKAALPYSMTIPTGDVALACGAGATDIFTITRWGDATTAALKDPSGFNLNIAKLFQFELNIEKPVGYCIESWDEKVLTTRPIVLSPDTPIALRRNQLAFRRRLHFLDSTELPRHLRCQIKICQQGCAK